MIRLVNLDYVKKMTTIERNVDDNKVAPFIFKVQDTHLQKALGTAFYKHILNGFDAGTLNADEIILVEEYIQPMLAEWVYYECYPHLLIKPTNKAISKERSEYSEAVGLNEMRYMRDSIRNMAEFYTKRLIKELCDFAYLKYPLYLNPPPKENVRKSRTAYFSGVYLKKTGDRYGMNRGDALFGDDCDC
jgi:hypothetical protein